MFHSEKHCCLSTIEFLGVSSPLTANLVKLFLVLVGARATVHWLNTLTTLEESFDFMLKNLCLGSKATLCLPFEALP